MIHMKSRAARFYEEIQDRTVCFIGAGVSHRELIRQFAAREISVTLRDRRSYDQLGEIAPELERLGVRLILGDRYLEELEEDIIFRTPGMKYHLPELEQARARGKVVTSEMEVFFDLCPCPIYGVTGSDGKTTTTTIISEMLRAEGYTVHLGGNIGRALLPEVEEIEPENHLAVVELSSFQLISMRRSPHVAVVTNVAPNHLDMHKDMQEYIDAKKNLVLHQNAFSRTVLSADNEIAASFGGITRGDTLLFSRRREVARGAYMDEAGDIYFADGSGTTKIMNRDDIKIPGLHNVENYLAAISAVWGRVSPATMKEVARSFGGVEHRIELVRTLDGVRWYNDSIATSPTRAIAGLDSFQQKIILIAGGYDKKIPFLPLAPKIIEKVKVLILMGATAEKIEDTVTTFAGYDPSALSILHAGSMEEAVELAQKAAREGDIVSLSPASASFDLYPNFEARGNHFKALVQAL